MKKILFILVLLGSTFLWASIFGEDEQKEILLPTHIIEISAKIFDESKIYNALGIEQKSIFEFWKDDTSYIKDKLLPTLHASLRSFYDSEGFYDANFTIEESNTTVQVNIIENQPIRIKDINISSDYNISSFVSFEKNEIFLAKKFISIKNKITTTLLQDGYCSSEFDTKAYVDLDTHSVNLRYILKKGGVCTFGKVTVKGLTTMNEEVVKSQVRAEEGERFNIEHIKDTSKALYGLHSFDSVIIGVDRKIYNVIPVDIIVQEKKNPYHFEVGVGYDSYVGPRVHSSITRYNLFGNALELKLQLAWSELEQLAIFSFYKPVFINIFDYYVGVGGEGGYSNLEYDGFQEEKEFLRVFLDHKTKKVKLRVGFALENITITALNNIPVEEELTQAVNEGTFLLTYPYIDFSYDARDSKLNPKYGYYLSAYLETGLSDEESSVYYKALLEARFIHTFANLTLATVGIVGIVDEERENSLPESKYFFAGGSFSNRAYGFREMGVILSPTEDSIYGASTWANITVEADYPIWGDVYGAVFSDNTLLSTKAYDFSGEIITSVGVGVRYISPIGPIKLDIGMNVQDSSQYGISFQIGQSF